MKKHIFFVACFWSMASGSILAQQKWTLEACIDYAVSHNISIRQSECQIKELETQRSTLKHSFLPTVSAGTSQKLAFGRSLNQDNLYKSSNIQNTAFSLNAEMPLFTGFKTTASISQNRYNLLAAEAEKEEYKNNLRLSVTTAYFQILLYHEICLIAEEQARLTEEQIKKTEFLIESGKIPQSQLFDVKAQLADDELAVTEARNSLRMATLELAQLMEWDNSTTLILDTTTYESIKSADMTDVYQIFHDAEACMPQIQKAKYALLGYKEEIKVAQSGYFPSVALGAGINTGYFHSNNSPNDIFKKQLKNNLQKNIYINLTIPLFNGFSTRNQVRSARIAYENATLSLENEKKKLLKSIEKAYADASSAYEKYQSTSKAVIANQEAHRYAKEKYDAGKSSVFEYNEIKMKLADALSQQSQAKFTYLLKREILQLYSCHLLT